MMMMGLGGWGRRVAVLAFASLVGACARASAVSNKATDYAYEPKRMFVRENFIPARNLRINQFDQRLIAGLGACGVAVETGPLPVRAGNGLEINDAADEAALRTASEEIQRFGADAVLTVIEARATQRALSGQLVTAEFGLSLYDVASKKTVWKAKIDLRAGMDGAMVQYGNSAHAVADAIVERLSQDGILRSCSASSKGAAPPA
jgi:hypothetical protein